MNARPNLGEGVSLQAQPHGLRAKQADPTPRELLPRNSFDCGPMSVKIQHGFEEFLTLMQEVLATSISPGTMLTLRDLALHRSGRPP